MQGLLVLNKPEGKTSYGAVAAIKHLTGEKRVGHTGTLDPLATGVLPVLIGRATVLAACLLEADKRYTATARLGLETDTCDITGEVTLRGNAAGISREKLETVLTGFKGNQKQVPPMYSALKKDGVRLYSLAREGLTVEIPERDIHISLLNLTGYSPESGEFTIDTVVSKGTYIRSLVRDIGRQLGCGATLTALCRSAASGFTLEDSVPLDTLTKENISDYIQSPERAVAHFREITVTEKQAVRFCNGGQLGFERLSAYRFDKDGETLRVKFGDELLGLGTADSENGQINIRCVLKEKNI